MKECPEVLTAKRNENIVMNGQEVFVYGVKFFETINTLLKKENTDAEDIKYFILHRANVRIIESVAKRLGNRYEQISGEPVQPRKYIISQYTDSA